MLEVKEVQTLSEQEKTISLFEFIKELNKLKQKVVLNIKDYFELQREAETEEIIVANGMLRDAQNPDIAHPVLTHRVQLEYDAMENVISISDQSLTI